MAPVRKFVKALKIYKDGRNVIETRYKSKRPLSRDAIERFTTRLSQRFLRDGIENMKVMVVTKGDQWRSGTTTALGQPTNVYRYENYYHGMEDPNADKIYDFAVILIPTPIAAGGASDKNDCLHSSIALAYGGRKKLPQIVRKASSLKKLLGIERDALIPVDRIKDCEPLFKCGITVVGDYARAATYDSVNQVCVSLTDGHYSLVQSKDKPRTKGALFKAKNVEDVRSLKVVDGVRYIYDGKVQSIVTAEELMKLRKIHSSNKHLVIAAKPGDSIEDTYHTFLNEAKEILALSDGKVNLLKYPKYKHCSLEQFQFRSKHIGVPDDIQQNESIFIERSFQGGLVYGEEFEGVATAVDMNSMYPYYMSSASINIPVKAGKFQVITKDKFDEMYTKRIFMFGIYRAIIGEGHAKLFRLNKRNYYTHYDLTRARELDLPISIIEDGEANFIGYESTKRINGRNIFGAFVTYFYDLKMKSKTRGAKNILNTLWGALCEKKHQTLHIKDGVSHKLVDNNQIVDGFKPAGDDYVVKTYDPSDVFEQPYARLGPFLTSFCRMHMSRIMAPYVDRIKRIHTDGFIVEGSKPALEYSTEIGKFKVEHSGRCKVRNSNVVEWLQFSM